MLFRRRDDGSTRSEETVTPLDALFRHGKGSTRPEIRALLDWLDRELGENWLLPDLIHAMGRALGKPILIRTLPGDAPVGLCGLLVDHEDGIVVLCPDTAEEHRDLVILHELAHLGFGHGPIIRQGQTSTLDAIASAVGVDAASVRSARGGAGNRYDSDEEYQAELWARNLARTIRRNRLRRRDAFLFTLRTIN